MAIWQGPCSQALIVAAALVTSRLGMPSPCDNKPLVEPRTQKDKYKWDQYSEPLQKLIWSLICVKIYS